MSLNCSDVRVPLFPLVVPCVKLLIQSGMTGHLPQSIIVGATEHYPPGEHGSLVQSL